MNRETRDKFASGTDQADLTTGNACWETAPAVFAKLNEDFGPFDIDLTADLQRHLCPVWFGPVSSVLQYDALIADWMEHGRNGYSNPPYGRFVPKILAKARQEAVRGFTSTLLLPLRITVAFRLHILRGGASDLILPDKRLVFFENGVPRCSIDKHGVTHPDTAMFDSMIVRYRPGSYNSPRLSEWKVPKHVFPEDIARWEHRRNAA